MVPRRSRRCERRGVRRPGLAQFDNRPAGHRRALLASAVQRPARVPGAPEGRVHGPTLVRLRAGPVRRRRRLRGAQLVVVRPLHMDAQTVDGASRQRAAPHLRRLSAGRADGHAVHGPRVAPLGQRVARLRRRRAGPGHLF